MGVSYDRPGVHFPREAAMWWWLAVALAGEPDERAIRADLRQGAVEVLIGGAMLSATPLLAPRRDDRSEASVRGVLFATFLVAGVNLTFNGVERRAKARKRQRDDVTAPPDR